MVPQNTMRNHYIQKPLHCFSTPWGRPFINPRHGQGAIDHHRRDAMVEAIAPIIQRGSTTHKLLLPKQHQEMDLGFNNITARISHRP